MLRRASLEFEIFSRALITNTLLEATEEVLGDDKFCDEAAGEDIDIFQPFYAFSFINNKKELISNFFILAEQANNN